MRTNYNDTSSIDAAGVYFSITEAMALKMMFKYWWSCSANSEPAQSNPVLSSINRERLMDCSKLAANN